MIPNMIESKNYNHRDESHLNSKKTSQIYVREAERAHQNLTNEIKESLIFMKNWNTRTQTESFNSPLQKGFESDRKMN